VTQVFFVAVDQYYQSDPIPMVRFGSSATCDNSLLSRLLRPMRLQAAVDQFWPSDNFCQRVAKGFCVLYQGRVPPAVCLGWLPVHVIVLIIPDAPDRPAAEGYSIIHDNMQHLVSF
jgi:hypothetical protein